MIRLDKFLLIIGTFLCVTTLNANRKKDSQNKPNILFISIDDLYTSIGATKDLEGNFLKTIYTDSIIRSNASKRLTPNIDKLASQGRQFTNAMCQSPLCGPSRTSMMTGIPVHVSGYYEHSKHFRTYETMVNAVTLPQYLKQNGYFTAGLGKIFHKPNKVSKELAGDWPDAMFSWDQWINSGGGANMGSAKHPSMSPGKEAGLMRFGAGNLPKEKTRDWQNAQFMAHLLKTGKASINDLFYKKEGTIELPDDKPFFLASGIFRPHLPFYAPQEYFDLFPTSEMSIDKDLFNKVVKDLEDLPPAAKKWTQLTKGKFHEVIEQGNKVGGEEGKIEAWKQCIQAYLACVAYADECVGEILNGLENSKYKDNTIVFLWSDHGYFLGNKARIAKQCLWRESLNCNLIVRYPGMQKQPGIPCSENVLLTDLYQTVVSLCGLQAQKNIIGEDLTALIKDPKATLKRKYVYCTYQEGNHALIGEQYKYFRYKNGDKELYNIQVDLNENNNLASNPEYKGILQKMDTELNKQLERGL